MAEHKGSWAYNFGLFLGTVVVGLILFSGLIASLYINGLVLFKMWEWFITPLGLPLLTLAHATGLGVLIRYLTWQNINHHKKTDGEDNNERIWTQIVVNFCYPLGVLLIGWAIKTIFM